MYYLYEDSILIHNINQYQYLTLNVKAKNVNLFFFFGEWVIFLTKKRRKYEERCVKAQMASAIIEPSNQLCSINIYLIIISKPVSSPNFNTILPLLCKYIALDRKKQRQMESMN